MAMLRTVQLKITVTYECDLSQDAIEHVPDESECHSALLRLADYAAGEGWLSENTPYLVSDWKAEVDSVGVHY